MTKNKKTNEQLRSILKFSRKINILIALIITIGIGTVIYFINANANISQVFHPNSFWYKEIPRNAPLHVNSQAYANNIKAQVAKYYGTATVNTKDYASSVYEVGANTPTIAVKFNDCQNKGYFDNGLKEQWSAVPIPSYAVPAGGRDAEMTIYQPSTNTLWEFWRAEKRSDGWYACWGGRMKNVSQTQGIWPFPYGTTATGLPFMGGQISIDEARAGVINHALGISLVEVKRSEISWPANRTDGWVDDPMAIPEGLRFRLDPNVDVESLNMHPYGKMMARSIQKYGMVVWDKAGAVSFRGENPTPYTQAGETNPYDQLFNGTPSYEIMKNFPWEKLQALPKDYGKNDVLEPSTPTPEPDPEPEPEPEPEPPTVYPAGTHNDTSLTFSNGWQTSTGTDKHYNDDHYSSTQNATATIRFSGTSVAYYGAKAPHHGIAAISIDNGPETLVDTFSAAREGQSLLYKSPTLSDTEHTLRIRVTGTKNPSSSSNVVSVDKIEVGSKIVQLQGDLNGDGVVDVFDLSYLLSRWSQNEPNSPADINSDGKVDIFDLSILLSAWNK